MTCAGTGMHGIATSPMTKPLNQMHCKGLPLERNGQELQPKAEVCRLQLEGDCLAWLRGELKCLPLPTLLLGLCPARADSPQIICQGCAASVRWVVPAYFIVGHIVDGHKAAEQRRICSPLRQDCSANPSPLPAIRSSSWPTQRQTPSTGDTQWSLQQPLPTLP